MFGYSFVFDMRNGLTAQDLDEFNRRYGARTPKDKKNVENENVGQIPFTVTCDGVTERYIADVDYFHYSKRERGFSVDLYEEKDDGSHGKWLVGHEALIRSATNYRRFCTRIQNAIIAAYNYV